MPNPSYQIILENCDKDLLILSASAVGLVALGYALRCTLKKDYLAFLDFLGFPREKPSKLE